MTGIVISPYLKTFVAEQIIESVSESTANNNLYLSIGKSTAWADELNPITPIGCLNCQVSVWRNMIGAKRISGSDIKHVIPRNDWVANTVYDQWDNSNTMNQGQSNANFYILTDEWNVYKCLYNNEGANSTIQPDSTSTSIVSTEDGYIWKYMYTVSAHDQFYYSTANYIPVKTLTVDNNSDQWDVQQAAASGAIYAIDMINNGENYNNANSVSVTITGDGSGATANATINLVSNTVESIAMTAYGTGYHYAVATITDASGNGTNASANVLISPFGGHGSDPLYELSGGHIMISTRLNPLEQSILTTNTEFRQVAIIKDPYRYGTSNIESNSVIDQMTTLTIAGNSFDYVTDEYVYQGADLANATFSGVVVEWDSANSALKLIYTDGTPGAEAITGETTGAIGFVSSVQTPDLVPYSGKVLYLNNIVALERDQDQTEEFKIVFGL